MKRIELLVIALLLAASMYAQAPTSPAKPPEAVSLPPTPQGHNIQASAESLQEIGQQQMQLDSQAALLREWNAWAKQVKEIVDKTACKAPTPPNKEP